MKSHTEVGTVAFDGIFQIWIYDISHGCLLLRRSPDSRLKRLDVLFKDVRVLQLSTYFDSLRIETKPREALIDGVFATEFAREPGLKLYRLSTNDWHGYIVGGQFFWQEDENGPNQPSAIYEPGPLVLSLGQKQ